MSPLIWTVDIILWGLVLGLVLWGITLTYKVRKGANNPTVASVVQTFGLATIAFIFTLLITLSSKLDKIIETLIRIEAILKK